MKILITAGTTGFAHKLKRLLDKGNVFIFADQEEMPAFVSNYSFIRIPAGGSFSFTHELLKCCLDEEIDYVFPLRKAEIKSLAEAAQLFEEYGIKVVIPAKGILSDLMQVPPVKGFLTVVINGSVYAAENDKTAVLPDRIRNGVIVISAENKNDHSIFTAD